MSGEQHPEARSTSLLAVRVGFHEFVDDGSYTTDELSDVIVVEVQVKPRELDTRAHWMEPSRSSLLRRHELRLTGDSVIDQCEGHHGGGDRDRFIRVHDMSRVDRGDLVLVSAHQPGVLTEQPNRSERDEHETEMLPVDPVAVTATQRAGSGDEPVPGLDDRNDVGPDSGRLDSPLGAVDELHTTAASEEHADGAVPSEPCDRAASSDQFMGRESSPADSAQRDRTLGVGRRQRLSIDRTSLRRLNRWVTVKVRAQKVASARFGVFERRTKRHDGSDTNAMSDLCDEVGRVEGVTYIVDPADPRLDDYRELNSIAVRAEMERDEYFMGELELLLHGDPIPPALSAVDFLWRNDDRCWPVVLRITADESSAFTWQSLHQIAHRTPMPPGPSMILTGLFSPSPH